jgi:hypothetical protein
MKLWILEPVDDNKLWKPWYDKAFGFVVRAQSEGEARLLAAKMCGDEKENAWLDSANSTCIELLPDGKEGVIIRDVWCA